jgi:hypothetical protein
MIAIIGANAEMYTMEKNSEKRGYWLSKLKDVKKVLEETHDNRVSWVDFLLAKCEEKK